MWQQPKKKCCGAGGAVIKLPPGAGITNYGANSGLVKFKVIFMASNKTIRYIKNSKGRKIFSVGAGGGAVIRI